MHPDVSSSFGTHRPGRLAAAMIRVAQSAPPNWFGKQLAHALRRGVLTIASPPLDVTVGRVHLRCHVADNYSEKKFVFTPWRFDRRELERLLAALPRDGVFVDIGANVGIHSLLVADHLGRGGRILALEPNPPAFARLQFNLAATRAARPDSDWPAVETVPIGVSDVAGAFTLHLDARDLGSSSLLAAGGDGGSGESGGGSGDEPDDGRSTVSIPCRPLLELLDEHDVNHVDALKIDIEGAEDAALVPFLDAAADERLPRLVMMENSEDQWTRDLPGALARRGYAVVMRSRMNSVYTRS